MSLKLFSKAPVLRVGPPRISPPTRASFTPQRAHYSSTSGPKMPSGTQQLRSLIRQTTLRASTIAAQRAHIPASQHFHSTSYNQRPRSPSPPPPYQARNTTLRASPDAWTRFQNSPYNTLSSVRTFSASPKIAWPAPEDPSNAISPEAQKQIEAAIEEISELYGSAKDEFDIASEETEKNTTYAADDREAAREELDALLEFYRGVVNGHDRVVGDEVRRRVGQRIRELENAVVAMEEAAMHGD